MLCPNCGKEMPDGNRCPHCNVDVVVYKKIVRLSDALYNKGLAMAKASNLSGAVSLLQKSIQINKDNVQAYNLLGIVHFEMGHVGDALKQWIISSNRFKESNPAAGYIEEMSKNGSMLERYSDAIYMYNNSLNYLQQKSEDLAIIQLKKAIEINPKFVDALNLLTLCYIITREKEKASQLVEKALYIDAQNPVTLNYHNVLHPGRRPSRKAPGVSAPVVTRATPPPEPVYRQSPLNEAKPINFHFAEIITFVLGVACMFSVYNWMIMPAVEREAARVQEELRLEATEAEREYRLQINDKDSEIASLGEHIAELDGDIETSARQNEFLLNTNRVLQAYNMYTDGKLQEAVDYASGLDITGQPPDIVERHQSIFALAYPQLGRMYFDAGSEAFEAEDFAKARVDFEKAALYTTGESEYRADLLYRLGMTYAEDENATEQTIEFLTKLLNDYPDYNRNRRNAAASLIEDLTEVEED